MSKTYLAPNAQNRSTGCDRITRLFLTWTYKKWALINYPLIYVIVLLKHRSQCFWAVCPTEIKLKHQHKVPNAQKYNFCCNPLEIKNIAHATLHFKQGNKKNIISLKFSVDLTLYAEQYRTACGVVNVSGSEKGRRKLVPLKLLYRRWI